MVKSRFLTKNYRISTISIEGIVWNLLKIWSSSFKKRRICLNLMRLWLSYIKIIHVDSQLWFMTWVCETFNTNYPYQAYKIWADLGLKRRIYIYKINIYFYVKKSRKKQILLVFLAKSHFGGLSWPRSAQIWQRHMF